MPASFSPDSTLSAMILLQASICLSVGVVAVVQSGPSWVFCARAGQSAPPSSTSAASAATRDRRMLLRPGEVNFAEQRRVAPRHLLVIRCGDDVGAHPRQHLLHFDARC